MTIGTKASWNFASALGDSVSDKCDALRVRLAEVSHLVYMKHKVKCNLLKVSEVISEIFSTTFSLGNDGNTCGRWRIETDYDLPSNEIYMGEMHAGHSNIVTPKLYARLTIHDMDFS